MVGEAAALRLGSTVAKAAAQMWLGGKRREQERRMDMSELIRVRVSGLRFQRGVERQFDEMADAVYDRLAPFLEREFPGLAENSRQAVIDAVCDTFAAADLSDEAILAADAKPAEIVRRLTGAARPPVGLGVHPPRRPEESGLPGRQSDHPLSPRPGEVGIMARCS
ncbi:NACHT N-terminal Helical domain 1-containing protein [Streptomyces sp. NBC_00566]|uniref:NACHT N-terminal Helical domain 1-containing protein n=1 Tax=Streptomyces sp. NBC_00566 TaxID=2975778 RepID=UPI002E822C4F|nr:hypothetical protein [Streptomyces sp. NBC_00566]WUB86610.1 hypothetical protein OG812_08420 [Streptomyces sp. NBC_00566]